MKVKSLFFITALSGLLFAGCGPQATPPAEQPTMPAAAPAEQTKPSPKADATTSASTVSDEAAFEKGISKDGTWIVITTKDMTFSKDLTIDGEFKNGKKDKDGKESIQRVIAPFASENKQVKAQYTVTAPKITVKSPNTELEHGIYKTDLYVESKNFSIVGAKVEGNIYFASDEAKSTFKIDDKSTVTGKQEVKK